MSTDGAETRIFECPDVMSIADAADLRDQLLELLEQDRAVVLDASRIERIDTAMLQLLCAFSEDARGRGIELEWRQPSEYLLDSARRLDLAVCLGLEQA